MPSKRGHDRPHPPWFRKFRRQARTARNRRGQEGLLPSVTQLIAGSPTARDCTHGLPGFEEASRAVANAMKSRLVPSFPKKTAAHDGIQIPLGQRKTP